MEVQTTSEFQELFPSFVLHKHWDMPPEFNDRLYALAAADCEAHRVTSNDDPRAIGDVGNHVAHLRHNFLVDTTDPIIPTFVNMISQSVREYLWHAFQYQHDGDIKMMADTFWQRRSHGENMGIPTHVHPPHEIICTYYPRVDLDEDCPQDVRQRGGLRFYDPGGGGSRSWPTNHPDRYNEQSYTILPEPGSMVVFEGHMPHDSTAFQGDERMCIPVLCKLDTPRAHNHKSIKEILEVQNGV